MEPAYQTLSVVKLPFECDNPYAWDVHKKNLASDDQQSVEVTIKVQKAAREVFRFKAYVEDIEIGFMSISMEPRKAREIIRLDNYTKKRSYLLQGLVVKRIGTTLVDYGLALNFYYGPQEVFAKVRKQAVEFFKTKGFNQGEKAQEEGYYYSPYEPICFDMWRSADSFNESLRIQLHQKIEECASFLIKQAIDKIKQ